MSDWKQSAVKMAETKGYSWRKISRVLGKSKSTISDHLRKHFKGYVKPSDLGENGLETIKRGEGVSHYQSAHLNASRGYKGPRILVYDIETAPLFGALWSMWQDGIGLNQITHDWYVLAFAAKWLGEDEIFYYDQRNAANPEDDYDLLLKIWELLNECDIAVGHNIVKFDTKKLNARFVLNGLPKPATFRQIDTLQIAKESFSFTSNKLEWLSDKLCGEKKSKHEKFPGYTLWAECLKNNPEAWETMESYNKQDILSTEQLYNVLSSWSNKLPNFDVYVDDVLDMSVWEKDGFHYSNLGKYQRYRNRITGQQRRSRVNLLDKEKRASLLSNIV